MNVPNLRLQPADDNIHLKMNCLGWTLLLGCIECEIRFPVLCSKDLLKLY